MAANNPHSRIKRIYAAAGILLLNTLLLCACIELVAWLILSWTAPQDKRPDLPPYRTESWGDAYWREFAQSEAVQYRPYVLWRRIPYSGTMIHVDDRGLRLTPGADCQEGAFTVFAFGGSTMWGTGARDGETIPAYLQAGLQAIQDGPVCVVNFGESGYVSTQSLITLITELQAGHVPDWVLFYDGINDTYAAYQKGKAGTHQNEGEVAAEMEDSALVKVLRLSRTMTLIRNRLGKTETYATMGINPSELAPKIVEVYLTNLRIVQALGQEYGFETAFFWQPVISVGNKPLTGDEQDIRDHMDDALVDLYNQTYAGVERIAPQTDHLYNLSHLFDGETDLLWIDAIHVTPAGNRLIAEAMLRTSH